MAKISLSPTFIKESFLLLREKSLKEIFFGTKVEHSSDEKKLVDWITGRESEFTAQGGRKGTFVRLGVVHSGTGTAYLLSNRLGDQNRESILLFDKDVAITSGPDLYVYLSPEADVRKNGVGDFLNLGLLKGTKGGQSYVIDKPIGELSRYQSVVIYCKQFSVLFTFAPLT